MSFIYRIIGYLNDLSDFFYDLMLEVWDWPFELWRIGYIFYDISLIFNGLAWRFSDFAEWLEWAADEIEDILSWSFIRSKIREWLDGIEDALEWWYDWWTRVKSKVEDWWEAVQVSVKGWIAIAAQGLADLIAAWDTFWNVTWPELIGNLGELRALWDTFWTTIFPTLVSFAWLETWWLTKLSDIGNLINSALNTWLPFYDDLVSLWEEIKTFFADPLQWGYNKLDEFFERFW